MGGISATLIGTQRRFPEGAEQLAKAVFYTLLMRRRFLRWVLLLVGVAGVFAGWQWVTWPDIAMLKTKNPKTTAFIEQYKARLIREGKKPILHFTPVPYTSISPHLKRAVLVGEDIDFFSHRGFAVAEIKKAMEEAWEDRELPRGASTITQQLAKNLWLSPSRNPWRKVKEALLTRQLERTLSKKRLLELYLNVVEFGEGVYGAEAAARFYFGTSAAVLDERRAAELAAGLPKPSLWHPGSHSKTYQRRVRVLLTRMDRAAFLWKQI